MIRSTPFRKNSHSTKNRSRRFDQIVQISFNQGKFEVTGLGNWRTYWRDPYYLFLTIPWPGFLVLMAAIYLVLNILFSLAYLAGSRGIENATPGSFVDAFFFSVQTFSTIGYGSMYPTTLYTHIVVTLEAFVGILSVALMTGLAFARFAQPTARVRFSKCAVITVYNNIPTLMFRTANQRRNQILEAQMRFYFMQDEITAEGELMRRVYELKLLRERTPAFSISWTVMHPIDATSPLYGLSAETLLRNKAMFIASLSGIDETVGQSVLARCNYGSDEIFWDKQFADIVKDAPDGHRYIDYGNFDVVVDRPS